MHKKRWKHRHPRKAMFRWDVLSIIGSIATTGFALWTAIHAQIGRIDESMIAQGKRIDGLYVLCMDYVKALGDLRVAEEKNRTHLKEEILDRIEQLGIKTEETLNNR